MASNPEAVMDRLLKAINDHDFDEFLDCFDPEYRSETPAHPQRAFSGRDQVRRNWVDLFEHVDDLQAQKERMVSDGDTFWLEWQVRGTLPDGNMNLVGVSIAGVSDGRIQWGRMYMEPIQETDDVTWEEFHEVQTSETS